MSLQLLLPLISARWLSSIHPPTRRLTVFLPIVVEPSLLFLLEDCTLRIDEHCKLAQDVENSYPRASVVRNLRCPKIIQKSVWPLHSTWWLFANRPCYYPRIARLSSTPSHLDRKKERLLPWSTCNDPDLAFLYRCCWYIQLDALEPASPPPAWGNERLAAERSPHLQQTPSSPSCQQSHLEHSGWAESNLYGNAWSATCTGSSTSGGKDLNNEEL
jgi:hypothetical protein